MLSERDTHERRDDLIKVISTAGDRYGSRLLNFMERYGLHSLAQATEEQLQEYADSERLIKSEN